MLRRPVDDRWWRVAVAAAASVAFSLPLMLHGTPDVESYTMSIFSTVAFVRNALAGVDPWFVPGYGFGIPLPSSTWYVRFPLGIPAAAFGIHALYSALWLGGEFVFGLYLLRLTRALTPHRGIAIFALVTGLLSFSNLGVTYRDDWPEHFMGWALFPACLWYALQTVAASPGRARLRSAAACALAMSIFTGSTHQNEIVTFFSGVAIVMAALAVTRPRGVIAVGIAAVVALAAAAEVIVPTVEGMLAGQVNPLLEPIAVVPDDLSLASYGKFIEPSISVAQQGRPGLLAVPYERVPFFGLLGLLCAIAGAARLFAGRVVDADLPAELRRALAIGFTVYSALTLMPAWVALGLPRMWMYRDGQTVFGILCAAAALDWVVRRRPAWFGALLAVQCAQVALVASPLITRVSTMAETRLFGARHEPALFDRLREAGVGEGSRVALAGSGIEELVRSGMASAGVSAATDFALAGIPIVNAWYRGAQTPALGAPSMDRRYGAYETLISWERSIGRLDQAGLDVLGITDLLSIDGDSALDGMLPGLRRTSTIELPNRTRIALYRNEDAWSNVVLLGGADRPQEPSARPGCNDGTVFCRDYGPLVPRLTQRLPAVWRGSAVDLVLPPDHPEGWLLVTEAVGPAPAAVIDGQPRAVTPFLEAFGLVEVQRGDRVVHLSVRRPRNTALTLGGLCLMLASLVVAGVPPRARSVRTR